MGGQIKAVERLAPGGLDEFRPRIILGRPAIRSWQPRDRLLVQTIRGQEQPSAQSLLKFMTNVT